MKGMSDFGIFPYFKINFDLDDRDRILRIDPCGKSIDIYEIAKVVLKRGYLIETLKPDERSLVIR